MKRLSILIFFLVIIHPAFSQTTGNIKGKIIDSKTKKPIEYASFAVKNVKDSSAVSMGATTTEGIFSVRALAFGQYKFYAALIGYKPIIKAFEITREKVQIDFGELNMDESAITLNDVLIKGELLPMIIKKDTIEFSADAFKTQADANVEDVLRVMPGMEVDRSGNISFNGKRIDRVLVDGKDFFGNNPKTATQNLPKEIVSKIQVIERKTDDAIFKGIDDGRRENVINIVLKDNKKKGYFGNIGLGKSRDDLYDASFNINRFNDKKQISVISFSNNVNRTGFSMDGLTDFFGGDIFSTGLIGGYASNGSGNVNLGFTGEGVSSGAYGGGINENKGVGFNFNNEWGKNKKLPNKIYVNYILMNNDGVRESLSNRLNLLGADSYFNDKNNTVSSGSSRQRFGMKLDLPLDSTAKIQIVPNFGFSASNADNSSLFSSYTQTQFTTINEGNSLNKTDNKTPVYGLKMSFNKRLKKKGRSFYVSGSLSHNNSDVDGKNYSFVTLNNGGTPSTTIINQLIDQAGEMNSYGVSISFTESINKVLQLSGSYSASKRADATVRSVYDYNTATTRYDIVNNGLTRDLANFNINQTAGLWLNYTPNEKFSLNLNSNQNYINLYGHNRINDVVTKKQYLLIQPGFNLSYKLNKTTSLSINGSRYSNVPSISQIQPLVDNSNPLLITSGNPSLRPSADNSLSLSFNRFGTNSGISFNAGLSASTTDHQIINNSLLDPKTGIQQTFYDNINGNYSLNGRIGGGFKIKRIGLSINPNLSLSLYNNNSFLNRTIVNSKTKGIAFGTSLNYAVGSALQLTNYFSASLRNVNYNYNNLPSVNFQNFYNGLTLAVSLPYEMRFNLSSDVSYNANLNVGSLDNTIHMANVGFEKLFLKKALILKGTMNDVFNNSRNGSRIASETFITESVTLEMRRYFIVGLSYRLRKFGETVK